jgi:L-lactate utilization protein LutB
MASQKACCEVCGVYRNLSTHHIHPKEFKDIYPGGSENIDEPNNLVILCQGCHAAVHSTKSFEKLVRDLKQKTKRRPSTPRVFKDNCEQSRKDRLIQLELWKKLIVVLQNIEHQKRLEEYRAIIQKISYVNSVWFLDCESREAA